MLKNLSSRQILIIETLKNLGGALFSQVYSSLGLPESERTINRDIKALLEASFLESQGGGRSLTYTLTLLGRLYSPVEEVAYSNTAPDERVGVLKNYQFQLWSLWPESFFAEQEGKRLAHLTEVYKNKISRQSLDVRSRELERFVIELSWKSSRIEGNTYTLLDTERLIKEGIPSEKNTKEETQMIINHKIAFDFILGTPIEDISRGYIEHVHALLMKDLITDMGLRKQLVGITGSNYRPLDNQFQIEEALTGLIQAVKRGDTVFDQALTVLVGISYIQPFVDGNKRTARLLANALLMKVGAAPLSYRNVDENRYRGALLTFYEQLSILPVKQILIEQYEFAVEHYS